MPDNKILDLADNALGHFERYHDYRVENLEVIPKKGMALLVFNHSLATYDSFLLARQVWLRKGRLVRGLGDNKLFQIPGLAHACSRLGFVPATPHAGRRLLEQGELVGVAPGGMWEALRPHNERYQLRWQGRSGFARLAIQCQAPCILAACPRADDLYKIYPSRLSDAVYRRLKFPIPIFHGRGPSWLPRKIQLIHYLSEPISPPVPKQGQDANDLIDGFFEHVTKEMQKLMNR